MAISKTSAKGLVETKDIDLEFGGAARALQQNLVKEFYREDSDQPVVYLFVGGNPAEIFQALGFRIYMPEITALTTAIRHQSLQYILKAESIGYGLDVCGYVKTDIGLTHLSGGQTDFGNIPKPDLLVCNFSGCSVYYKWWESLAEFYKVPLIMLDVPYQRHDNPQKEDLEYITAQIHDMLAQIEKLFGKTLDMNKLKEVLAYSRKAEEGWARSFKVCENKPSPTDAYFESIFYMFPINALRGTKEAADFYELYNKELDERIKYGIGPVEEETFRYVMEGVPPYPGYRQFWDMFRNWGAVSVAATYPKVGGMFDFEGLLHDPSKPFESIAKYSLYSYCNLSWEHRRETIKNYLHDFDADALVIHGIKSCRSFTAGQGDLRDYTINELGIPALYVESDHQDPRYWAEAQIRNRVDAFFEALKMNKT
ncbi:MAG: 2-hydroxyacyl-CoA dehydratase family protein [Candidatus Heimdallarchaeota archaeon]|nr:2-hydroxyacyl-CoA dehydratase family protein [Candidatus Heimdallarchaeota archaeon]MDH5645785.1 2-hydroxyacyl-CoA dehydratase family protein [Candidatus Heimdallarchaeota archaeon]